MRAVIFFLSLLLSPVVLALDVWEFSLIGLNPQSKLVYFTPDAHEEDGTFVRDAQGNFKRIKINSFIDENNRSVLKQCVWNKTPTLLECDGTTKGSTPIKYEGAPLKTKKGTDTITAPIEAARIQEALAKLETCTGATVFFTCKENCPANLPKDLLLVYCGD